MLTWVKTTTGYEATGDRWLYSIDRTAGHRFKLTLRAHTSTLLPTVLGVGKLSDMKPMAERYEAAGPPDSPTVRLTATTVRTRERDPDPPRGTCPDCCGAGYVHTHGGEKDPDYAGLHDRRPCPRGCPIPATTTHPGTGRDPDDADDDDSDVDTDVLTDPPGDPVGTLPVPAAPVTTRSGAPVTAWLRPAA